ncbi:hypothetical protein (plasmid) [Metabacillus dongyingensis]|nr:hypothetical protein [Metabacillus dongyingensis]
MFILAFLKKFHEYESYLEMKKLDVHIQSELTHFIEFNVL